jgi:cardiolipin synthase
MRVPLELIRPYHLFTYPAELYETMLDDIAQARKYVFLETFRMTADRLGIRFRDLLAKKAEEGVEVKLLVDYWGVRALHERFFDKIRNSGGEVRFFEKIKFNTDFLTQSHRRNHRKLLLIDDEVSYIGSSNITGYNLEWRESVLRMEDDVTTAFRKVFLEDFENYRKYVLNIVSVTKKIVHGPFEILRDVPNIAVKKINYRIVKMINEAKKRVTIETPYFLPGFLIRKAMINAVKRGVEVQVIMPSQSDVNVVDVLRNKYLGPLYRSGIHFLLYKKGNLHAKLLLIDNETFAIGSPNFDYRSYRYMFEIMLVGHDHSIIDQIKQHVLETIEHSEPFNYKKWLERPYINRLFEWLILPFRHYL